MRHPVSYKVFENDITFGYNWLAYDSDSKVYHPGIDYNKGAGNSDLGEPVYAVDFGFVEKIAITTTGYGRQVNLRHDDGYSKYAHLQTILVKEGDYVTPLTQIGTMGNSGTTSAHTHCELLTNELVAYAKTVRKDWWQFYPVNRSKAWVQQYYKNPYMFLNPRLFKLMIVFNSVQKPAGYDVNIKKLQDWFFEKSGNQMKLDVVDVKFTDYQNAIWNQTTYMGGINDLIIDPAYYRYWVAPHASGYDLVSFAMSEALWKSPGVIGFSRAPKMLGIEGMGQICRSGWSDSRFNDLCDGDEFIGVLRHEICHSLYKMCDKGNFDKTHEYEKENNIAKVFNDVDFKKMIGWNPAVGERMFKYGGVPTKKKWIFSGNPVNNKVYRTTDNRLFFKYLNGWKQIQETEFESAVKNGAEFGSMAVQEGNWIIDQIGGTFPPEEPGSIILERIVTSTVEKLAAQVAGWSTTIPNKHLFN